MQFCAEYQIPLNRKSCIAVFKRYATSRNEQGDLLPQHVIDYQGFLKTLRATFVEISKQSLNQLELALKKKQMQGSTEK